MLNKFIQVYKIRFPKSNVFCFIWKSILCLIILIVTQFPVFAQLDTIHYIAPAFRNTNPPEVFVYISTPSLDSVDYTVENGAGTVLKSGIVTSGYSEMYALADSVFIITETITLDSIYPDRGLIVHASDSIYVNVRLEHTAQASSITSKGRIAFDTTFRIIAPPVLNAPNTSTHLYASVGVMATEDSTTIHFDLTGSPLNLHLSNHLANVPFSIELNRGETYVLAAGIAVNNTNLSTFLGKQITSDKPITVTSGAYTGYLHNIQTNGSRDVMLDQLVGGNTLGNEFVLVRGRGIIGNPFHEQNEIGLITAYLDSTAIYVNDDSIAVDTINKGEFYRIEGTNYINYTMFIRTSQPASCTQFALGSVSLNNNSQGMGIIPPMACNNSTFVDHIPEIDKIGNRLFASIVTITTKLGSDVTINGQTPPVPPIAVTGAPYEVYRIEGLTGNISIHSSTNAAVSFLGFNGNSGYLGYFSGFESSVEAQLDVAADDNEIACGGQIPIASDILNNIAEDFLFSWSPAEFLDDPYSATPIASPDSTTTFTVNIERAGSPFCFTSSEIEIKVVCCDNPQPDTCTTYQGLSLDADLANSRATYEWIDGSTSTDFFLEDEGTYWVKTRIGPCTSVDSFFVARCPQPIPNIFTPNGDGQNDFLNLSGYETMDGNWDLEVYNRWGKLVFRQNDYDHQWTAEGLPDGTYFYHYLNDMFLDGDFKGWIQIER